MDYRTPRARVSGFGSARDGVHHWWAQRVTAVALVPLAVLFAVPFATAVGGPYEEALALYRQPFHAIVAVLFLAVTFYHLMLGLQVVIEDYVHHKVWRTALLLGNTMFCAACGLAGIFAVLKIAFTG
jgi:succinate dehydrogenase / fumarate reductase membrane anchor subunit